MSCAMQNSIWKLLCLWRTEACMWEYGMDETEMLLFSILKHLYSHQNVHPTVEISENLNS